MTTSDQNFHYVYVLESKRDAKRYIGITSDLRRRFQQHQRGESFATRGRRPFSLVYYEASRAYGDAKAREKYFKTTPGRRYLTKRLKVYYEGRNPKLS